MEQTASCHIFAAGSFYGLRVKPAPSDYIIAADGGYRWCLQEGLRPNLLLGDFDSLTEALPPELPTLVYPCEKDDTDTMLAIKTALDLGYRRLHLHGCAGGRLDHTIANLQALSYLAKEGARGFLYAETETFTAITEETFLLPAQLDSIFSVFCLGADASGVTIAGAKYLLEDGILSASFPIGVSNRFIGKPVSISVKSGCLLIGWAHLT